MSGFFIFYFNNTRGKIQKLIIWRENKQFVHNVILENSVYVCLWVVLEYESGQEQRGRLMTDEIKGPTNFFVTYILFFLILS